MQMMQAVSLVVAIVLTGCATQYGPKTMVEGGRYARAYAMVHEDGPYKGDRQSLVQLIQETTRTKGGNVFLDSYKESIQIDTPKDVRFFETHLRNINFAYEDKLITAGQRTELVDLLTLQFAMQALKSPELLQTQNLLNALKISADKTALADRALQGLIAIQGKELEQYFSIFNAYKSENSTAGMERAVKVMRPLVDVPTTTLKGQKAGFYALEIYVRYVEVTGDRSMDEKILGLLGETKLSKANLEVVEKVFPDYSKALMAARSIKVEFKTNGDEFLLSELADEVQKVNEWVEVTPDATKKILFNRLRLNEQRMPPTTNTEIIPDPDFGTLLMIPKNASVLIDYTSSEYSLQWNFTVQDPQSRKSKTFSGNRKFKRIECRNARYQNVFGGVGALYSFPNARTQQACAEGAGVDFDVARASVLQDIAKEINNEFLAITK